MSSLLRWQIGDVKITRVQEWEAGGMGFILPEATPENLAGVDWIDPFVDEKGEALGSVHTLAIEVGDRCVLVDTCIGYD
jgi:hypothetical protein